MCSTTPRGNPALCVGGSGPPSAAPTTSPISRTWSLTALAKVRRRVWPSAGRRGGRLRIQARQRGWPCAASSASCCRQRLMWSSGLGSKTGNAADARVALSAARANHLGRRVIHDAPRSARTRPLAPTSPMGLLRGQGARAHRKRGILPIPKGRSRSEARWEGSKRLRRSCPPAA